MVCGRKLNISHSILLLAGLGSVRNNRARDCAGAGVRVGGHVADDVVYGVENEVSSAFDVYLVRSVYIHHGSVISHRRERCCC